MENIFVYLYICIYNFMYTFPEAQLWQKMNTTQDVHVQICAKKAIKIKVNRLYKILLLCLHLMNSKLILNGHCTSREWAHFCYSLLNTAASSLTHKYTRWTKHNSSLVMNFSSECTQTSVTHNLNTTTVVAFTGGQVRLKQHSRVSRNLTLVWPLSPADLQQRRQRSTHSRVSTAFNNRYDTDTTAGDELLQEKCGQGFLMMGGHSHWLRFHGMAKVDSICPSKRWVRVENIWRWDRWTWSDDQSSDD